MSKLNSLIKIAIRIKDLKEDSNTDKVLKSALVSRINKKPNKLTNLEKELSLKLKLTDKERNIDNLVDRIITSEGLSRVGGSLTGRTLSYKLLANALGVLPIPGMTAVIPVSALLGGIAGSNTGKKLNNSIRDSYVKKHLNAK